jgi:TolB protein
MAHVMFRVLKQLFSTVFGVFLCVALSHGLVIDITDSVESSVSIAIVPFANNSAIHSEVNSVVSADLRRTGEFEFISRSDMLQHPAYKENIDFTQWRRNATDYILVGRILHKSNRLRVEYELVDILTQEIVGAGSFVGSSSQLRSIAHRISDRVYKELTGKQGIFSTSIAYITKSRVSRNNSIYTLNKSDYDGANPIIIKQSSEPILSPTWSPNGKYIAYVSFEKDKPEIYIHNTRTGGRELISSYPGLNSAPSWSPDGSKLAFVLSKDGNPEIYTLHLATRKMQRLTYNKYAIDTEPSWFPDSRHLAITSNRGGGPQIYRLDTFTGNIKRLTFNGRYNSRAQVFANGEGFLMVHKGSNGYRIGYQNLKNGSFKTISNHSSDESPSVAPNSSMLLYSSQSNQGAELKIKSINRNMIFSLPINSSDIREPAWSRQLNLN